MRKNKISIHLENGNIYFANQNSGESICHFFLPHQDYDKKLFKIKLTFGANCDSYLSQYLVFIKSEDDNRFDMLTN